MGHGDEEGRSSLFVTDEITELVSLQDVMVLTQLHPNYTENDVVVSCRVFTECILGLHTEGAVTYHVLPP